MENMVQSTEPKPCPFCGGKAVTESWEMSPFEIKHIPQNDGHFYAVWCEECCASGPDCLSLKEAIEAWNNRT